MLNLYNQGNLMKTNEKGFSVFEIIIVIVIVGLVGTVGWLVKEKQEMPKTANEITAKTELAEQKADNTEKPVLISKIKFENETSFDLTEKQKILSRIAEPLLFYHEEVLKIELKEVLIKKSTNMMSSIDARYTLNYPHKNDPASSKLGFIFGRNNKIEYWQPQLCDHGGCIEYPTALKNKFPDSYNAYLACKAASDAGDKEKANSIGCSLY